MSHPNSIQALAARFVIISLMVSMCSASDLISKDVISELGVNPLAPRNLVVRGVGHPPVDGGSSVPPDSPGGTVPDGGTGEQVPGGLFPVDPEDPYIKALACWAVYQLDNQTNSIYQRRPIRFISAFKQVQDRELHELRMTVGTTDCLKGQNCEEPVKLLDCTTESPNRDYVPLVCYVKIWGDAPWLDQKTVIKHWCFEIAFEDLYTDNIIINSNNYV